MRAYRRIIHHFHHFGWLLCVWVCVCVPEVCVYFGKCLPNKSMTAYALGTVERESTFEFLGPIVRKRDAQYHSAGCESLRIFRL